MVVKLLAKNEVTKAKEQEKKREIDEGLKIARSVDNLREVRATEEAGLEEFRKNMAVKYMQEIERLTFTRDTLTHEVEMLERRKKEALKPLQEEWDKVTKVIEGLDKQAKDLDEREKTVVSQETEAKTLQNEAEVDNKLAKEASKATQLALSRASSKEKKADENLNLSALQRKESEGEIIKRMQALDTRENQIAGKEKRSEGREKILDQRERDLNARETRLNDRTATLERNIKRNA